MYNVRLMDAIMSKLTFFLSLIKMINLRSEMVSTLCSFATLAIDVSNEVNIF